MKSFATLQMNAQKVGYIDTEKILAAIPAYRSAQSQLESLSKQYQEEIELVAWSVGKMGIRTEISLPSTHQSYRVCMHFAPFIPDITLPKAALTVANREEQQE